MSNAPKVTSMNRALWHLNGLWPFLAILLVISLVPLAGNDYWTVVATRGAIYWVLISGLTLIIGYAGQLAIGYVALLALGAYTTSILALGNHGGEPLGPFLALAAAGAVGGIFGLVVGLPALRLRTFYFAITTIGFFTIVNQVALAWQGVTGGGLGISGPLFPSPFDTTNGFFFLCLAVSVLTTWLTGNIARSRYGRALVAIRDAEVAAEASGINKAWVFSAVFVFSGVVAGIAGGLFASLQTYITPDAFNFELTLLFFIAVLIGGHGSILGPLIGTIVLTLLPEFAAPLAAWSTALYGALLLAIVLAVPGGIASVLDFRSRRPLASGRIVRPLTAGLRELLEGPVAEDPLELNGVSLSFGGLKAIDGLDLAVRRGEIHGLIGPNGSGKTTTLNVISGYYVPQSGTLKLGDETLNPGKPAQRASYGIGRTFQKPKVVGGATVLDNVMIGEHGNASFIEILFSLPRRMREERDMRRVAHAALRIVGLDALADVRADRLQHSELRFVEIARALVQRPAFLLLDEPAAGLSGDEIAKLGDLIKEIAAHGTGVLLVEHHTDLIFDICDHITVLNLGKVLAADTPEQIRVHKEVVSAYLGG